MRKKNLGVTLIETLLVLSVSAAIAVVSIRYYESTVASYHANRVVADIMSLTSTMDSMAENGSYLGMDNAKIKSVLTKDALNTPWGTVITLGNVAINSYEVTLPATPGKVCAKVVSELSNNHHYHISSTCQAGAADLRYVYTVV